MRAVAVADLRRCSLTLRYCVDAYRARRALCITMLRRPALLSALFILVARSRAGASAVVCCALCHLRLVDIVKAQRCVAVRCRASATCLRHAVICNARKAKFCCAGWRLAAACLVEFGACSVRLSIPIACRNRRHCLEDLLCLPQYAERRERVEPALLDGASRETVVNAV